MDEHNYGSGEMELYKTAIMYKSIQNAQVRVA